MTYWRSKRDEYEGCHRTDMKCERCDGGIHYQDNYEICDGASEEDDRFRHKKLKACLIVLARRVKELEKDSHPPQPVVGPAEFEHLLKRVEELERRGGCSCVCGPCE